MLQSTSSFLSKGKRTWNKYRILFDIPKWNTGFSRENMCVFHLLFVTIFWIYVTLNGICKTSIINIIMAYLREEEKKTQESNYFNAFENLRVQLNTIGIKIKYDIVKISANNSIYKMIKSLCLFVFSCFFCVALLKSKFFCCAFFFIFRSLFLPLYLVICIVDGKP